MRVFWTVATGMWSFIVACLLFPDLAHLMSGRGIGGKLVEFFFLLLPICFMFYGYFCFARRQLGLSKARKTEVEGH